VPGRDRILDSATGDYLSDGKGGWQTTTDVRTAVWHAIADEREHWVGDTDAGSELWRFERVGNSQATAIAAKDAMVQCLQPFVEKGLASNLVVTTDRDPLGRLTILTSIHDVSHGPINVAPITPGGP
jgi:phage gp46-like protein